MAQRESLPASDGSECENLSDKFLEEAMDPKVKEIGLHVCPESNTVCTQTTREVVLCAMSSYFFQQFAKLLSW